MTEPVRHRRCDCLTLASVALLAMCLAGIASSAAAQDFFSLKGHGGPIKGVAAGNDGTILTASFDNSVGLWREGAPLWLEGHAAAVNAVVYLGGGRVVSAGDDFSVRFWDSASGTSRELGRHEGKVIQLALSPDGARVASASWDGTARIWALDGGTEPIPITGHDSNVNDVAFSPDGDRLYTASSDGTIGVWNAHTGASEGVLVRHGFGITTLIVSEDEGWVAYGAIDGGTRVVGVADAAVSGDFTLDRRPILALAYHPGTGRIAVGDAHGYIMMIDTADWRIADDFRATLAGPVWALAFSPDGRNIHAGGLDNAMYSWPVEKLGEAAPMRDDGQTFLTPPEEMSNGERQFQRKCSICHTTGPDSERRAGPTLFRVFGREAGSLPGYPYSQTLQEAGIIWNEATIEQLFDLGPDHFIPGSKMPMQRITDAVDRADLIAFLKSATASRPE